MCICLLSIMHIRRLRRTQLATNLDANSRRQLPMPPDENGSKPGAQRVSQSFGRLPFSPTSGKRLVYGHRNGMLSKKKKLDNYLQTKRVKKR